MKSKQMVGTANSPVCKSSKKCYYATVFVWPHRLTVRTPAFQAVNPGSIPGGVTVRAFALTNSEDRL